MSEQKKPRKEPALAMMHRLFTEQRGKLHEEAEIVYDALVRIEQYGLDVAKAMAKSTIYLYASLFVLCTVLGFMLVYFAQNGWALLCFCGAVGCFFFTRREAAIFRRDYASATLIPMADPMVEAVSNNRICSAIVREIESRPNRKKGSLTLIELNAIYFYCLWVDATVKRGFVPESSQNKKADSQSGGGAMQF